MLTDTVRCLVDAKALLGESTYWDPQGQVLWWIDIYSKHIHRYDPATDRDENVRPGGMLHELAAATGKRACLPRFWQYLRTAWPPERPRPAPGSTGSS